MKEHRDKLWSDFYRLLDAQKFETQEDLQKFLNGLSDKLIPSIDPKS